MPPTFQADDLREPPTHCPRAAHVRADAAGPRAQPRTGRQRADSTTRQPASCSPSLAAAKSSAVEPAAIGRHRQRQAPGRRARVRDGASQGRGERPATRDIVISLATTPSGPSADRLGPPPITAPGQIAADGWVVDNWAAIIGQPARFPVRGGRAAPGGGEAAFAALPSACNNVSERCSHQRQAANPAASRAK